MERGLERERSKIDEFRNHTACPGFLLRDGSHWLELKKSERDFFIGKTASKSGVGEPRGGSENQKLDIGQSQKGRATRFFARHFRGRKEEAVFPTIFKLVRRENGGRIFQTVESIYSKEGLG